MIYDVIVVGGGIAGLYTAYKLLQKDPKLNLLVLEKNNYFGGRIYTVKHQKLVFEAGAGRFNETHVLLQKLIRDLGLQSKVTAIPSDIKFAAAGSYHPKYENMDPFQVMNPVLIEAKKTPLHILREKTFIEFAREILPQIDSQFLEDSFGYYEQLVSMNAYDALKLFDKGMHTKHNFFVLKDGMSQIIDKLTRTLTEAVCRKNTSVSQITYNTLYKWFELEIEGKPGTYITRQCVAALPKPALESIPFFKPIQKDLGTIQIKPLCRIYAQFDSENIWFKQISKTTTNNRLRYVIPIDDKQGLIMISYTDGKYARYWKDKSEAAMIKRLKTYVHQTFDIHIESPKYTKVCYWPIGTAYWKPDVTSYEVARKMLEPFAKECPGLYICGENYSTNQGWMEGALETAELVVEKTMTMYNSPQSGF